jgi:hypothetical protein
MDFLLEAVREQRRWLRLRDLLLLLLRMAAVVLFGLALARPYWTAGGAVFDESQPLHAVLLVDNSLSMAYETLGTSSLDRARARAREFLAQLPPGSRYSIVALCGDAGSSPPAPMSQLRDAHRMLERIQVVDSGCDFAQAVAAARQAAAAVPEMVARIVLLSDQQLVNFRDHTSADAFQDVPPMQLVFLGPAAVENTWVESLRPADDIADPQTPATLLVRIRHQGSPGPADVPVTLSVRGQPVASQTVSLTPARPSQELVFRYPFAAPEDGGSTVVFRPVSVSLPADRLPLDNSRHVCLPVMHRFPILFVDQFGPQSEDPLAGRYGETWLLRRLLVPKPGQSGTSQQAIEIRHTDLAGLQEAALEQVRVVVLAGVPGPGDKTSLLRQFVAEGGQLLIAAGAAFDPLEWQRQAWLEGGGILPAPVRPEFIGQLPADASGPLEPFFLSAQTMLSHPLFRLPGAGDQELQELYAEPFFFRAVAVDTTGPSAGPPDTVVLARFNNGSPCLVQRTIGGGQVYFFASGLLSDWNTLPRTNAFLVFDRLVRRAILDVVPQRNFPVSPSLVFPLQGDDPRDAYLLVRPGEGSVAEPLEPGFINAEERGLTIADVYQRGIYRVLRQPREAMGAATTPREHMVLAVCPEDVPPPGESDLTALTREQFQQRIGEAALGWVDADDAIGLHGTRVRAKGLWRLLAAIVLALLLCEMGILAWWSPRDGSGSRAIPLRDRANGPVPSIPAPSAGPAVVRRQPRGMLSS